MACYQACSHRAMFRVWAYLQCWILFAAADHGGASQDGLGLAYAESCQAKLFAYRNASTSYYAAQPSQTSYYTGTIVKQSYPPGTTSIASLTTLCDGHPRVVGPTIRTQGPPTNITSVYTNTNYFQPSTGFMPPPCTIGPKDCQSLYSSWTSAYSTATTAPGFAGLLDPPCTTSTQSHSYSTNSAGQTCDNCQVAGSKARLLYWPITTVPGSGNLCNKTAITIPGTRTAEGPNTFVTAGVTITSPTIAVSIASLSRVDGCGTTVATTIIPVNPEEVSSVRGNRALFTHYPFNFADLNWHCPDGEFVTDTGHSNCYQEVPAAAYFDGTEKWAGLDAMRVNWRTQKNLTIWNDYHPQLLPPKTMEDTIHSIWGKDCNIHPNGIWDPPIALQKATAIVVPGNSPVGPTESHRAPTITAAPRTYTAEYATQTMNGDARASPEATGPGLKVPHGLGSTNPGSGDASTAGYNQPVPSKSNPPTHGGSPASHGGNPASHGGNAASHGGNPASHGGNPASHGGNPASHGGSPASHGGNPPSHGGNDNENEPEHNGGAAQGEPSSKQIVVIHSVTFTRQVQSHGAEVWTNAQTHFTVPKVTGGTAPVVVISQETYTVSAASNAASGSGSEPDYYIIGDGTTYPIEDFQSTSDGLQTQSGPATDNENTREASDRRSGPTSTSSTGNAATTRGTNAPSQSVTLQSSATSVLPMPLSMLLVSLCVVVVLALQSG